MDHSTLRLKVVRLSDCKLILNEELYEDFEKNYKCGRTAHGTHHFHIMEFEHFIAGKCLVYRSLMGPSLDFRRNHVGVLNLPPRMQVCALTRN